MENILVLAICALAGIVAIALTRHADAPFTGPMGFVHRGIGDWIFF
jgi:hypothetical protein